MNKVTEGAFIDELEKIAQSFENKEESKKLLRNTAIIALGTGAGIGLSMVGEKALGALAGEAWNKMPLEKRIRIVDTVAGLTSGLGVALTLNHFKKKREKAYERED